MSIPDLCELPGHKGPPREAEGFYQVYCDGQPTMTRPCALCEKCLAFARRCGMTPKEVEAGDVFEAMIRRSHPRKAAARTEERKDG